MKPSYVLLILEILAISFSIIFPEIVPFAIAGIITIFIIIIIPEILPVLLISLMGINEITPGINLGNFSISPIQIIILLALFYILLDNIYKKPKGNSKYNNIFFYLLFAFYLISFFSLAQAVDKVASLKYLRDLFFYITFAFVIVYWINNYSDFKRITNSIKIAGLVVAVLGIIQLVFKIDYSIFVEQSWWGVSGSKTFFRIKSTFRDPNFLSNFLLLPLFISTADYINSKKLKNFLILFFIAAAFILTNSRGGLLAAFTGMAIFFGILYYKKGSKLKYTVSIITIIVIFAVIIINLPKEYLQRSIATDSQADWSSIFRVYFLIVGFQIIASNTFLGIGINNFPIVLQDYAPDVIVNSLKAAGKAGLAGGGYAHNTFITIWAETGILNALILIIMFFLAFYIIFKVKRSFVFEQKSKVFLYAVVVGFISITIQILTITYITYHSLLAFLLMMPIYNILKLEKS